MQVAGLQSQVAALKFDRSKWKPTKFGDVVACVDKACRNPAEVGLTRIVGLDNLDPGELKIERWGDIADGTSFTRSFRSGQILFGKRRAYQRKVALADFDGICSGDILVFEPKGDGLISELLPFLVQSQAFFANALGTSAGSLSPRTKWKELAKWEFMLPPRDDQRRIADLLCASLNAVQGYQKALSEANRARNVILNQLFGVQTPDEFESDFNSRWIPASEICTQIVSGYTPKEMFEGEGDIPFIKVYNLTTDGSLNLDYKPTYIRLQTHRGELKRSAVLPGDVLMNIVGPPLGKVSVVPSFLPKGEANINQAIVSYRLKDGISSRLFAAYLLRAQTLQWIMQQGKKTSGQLNITRTTCRALPVPQAFERADFVKDAAESLRKWDSTVEQVASHLSLSRIVLTQLSSSIFGGNLA